jgi:hypothetical protein
MGETWSNHVAIVVEGVLRQPNDSSSIISGLLLYKSLVKDHRVSLIFDSSNKEKIQYWLLTNSLTDHVGEIYWEDVDSDDVKIRRIAQVGRLRKNGPLSMVIESDMDAATALFNAGIPTMMYLHPIYAHPEFRPGNSKGPTPWNELLAEKIRQQEARATDTRLNTF